MIETLRIEGIAIVEEAELEFGTGLNVLTGETGAGKSIVLGALSLLAGARAASDALRDGAERGCVEAVFRTDALPDLEAELAARGLAPEAPEPDAGASEARSAGYGFDVHELVAQRTLHKGGRSRARVGGQLVPVATLAALFDGRLEISSQHSSQALLRPEMHARLLDEAGGLLSLRGRLAETHARARALSDEIDALRARAEERERERDFLRFQLDEIDAVGLQPGEVAELDREHRRLAHGEQLRSEGAAAVTALAGGAAGDEVGALDGLARAQRLVEALGKLDPELETLAERLRAGEDELRDCAADLERYVDRIDADPARLEQMEERLAQVEKLRRKYGGGGGDDAILGARERLAAERDALEGADARSEALEAEREAAAVELGELAAKLSKGRARAARKLAKAVEAPLRELALPDARFSVALEPIPAARGELPCGPAGAETVAFELAANAGEAPRPLQRVASGGELSRVFLALKNALRGSGGGMVLVFDEVDAGIGGRVAERVGRVLAELALHHQVLCITHLPQIAAFADRHFRVEKGRAAGRTRRTTARVVALDEEARVHEIARMAGGEKVSDATLAHARELLEASRPESR